MPGRRVSLHAVVIVLSCLSAIWLFWHERQEFYQQGLQMKPVFWAGVPAMFGLLALAGVWLLATVVAIIRALMRKGTQPVAAVLVSLVLVAGSGLFLEFPDFTDGVADIVAKRDEAFYLRISKRLRELPNTTDDGKVPLEFLEQEPELAAIFPNPREERTWPRFFAGPDYLEVSSGWGRGVGFRVCESSAGYPSREEMEQEIFKRVYSRVFAYVF